MSSEFMNFCRMLDSNIDFTASGAPRVPFKNPFDANAMKKVIKSATALLPLAYQNGYAEPLAAHLPVLTARVQNELQQERLKPKERTEQGIQFFEPLVGAVYDHDDTEVRKPLRRFLAVISDLYRSFLDRTQRANTNIPLVEQLPPLATFANSPNQGPFTVPSDSVKSYFGGSIGVVSLPSSYRDAPIIWPALGHEVGGHDVTHADVRLLPELSRGIQKKLGDPDLGRLWAYWMDEASADVYGLLNIGPTFVLNFAGFISAFLFQFRKEKPAAIPLGRLGTQTFIDETGLDPHPTDILRVYLAVGVIEQLENLTSEDRAKYIEMALQVAQEGAGNAKTIDIVRVDPNTSQLQTVRQFPIKQMQDAAKTVGGFIATTKLKSLNGHSIQEIETWDDRDEHVSQVISEALLTEKSVVGKGDDAQVLAGATLALYGNPGEYQSVTNLVNEALDASFGADPIFGTEQVDYCFSPGRMRWLRGISSKPPRAMAARSGA